MLVANLDDIWISQPPGLSKCTVSRSRGLNRARESGEIRLIMSWLAFASLPYHPATPDSTTLSAGKRKAEGHRLPSGLH